MINVVCGIRSTGRICTDLADALTEQGHKVKIAYGRETVPDQYKKYAVRFGTDLDVKLHGVRARLLDESGFGSKRATIKFIKWVRKYDPDVIHLHNIHGYYINIEVLFDYLRTCGKKIIWTLHDCWAFTGHSALCDGINCKKWEKGCESCPNLKEYPKSFLDYSKNNWLKKRKIFTKIPNLTIVTPSKWLAALVKKSYLKEYPIQVINNGIDTSQFHHIQSDFRSKYGLNNRFLILGVATAWNNLKGLSDYIKLSYMLSEDYKIILVGLTQEQLKGLPNHIIGIERTNSLQELAEIYSSCNLYLNLSYCETYPTVIIESLSCGTPVISYRTGGCPEILDNIDCYLVDKGRIDKVKEKIKMINRSEIIKIDKSKYDYHTSVKKYIDMYCN